MVLRIRLKSDPISLKLRPHKSEVKKKTWKRAFFIKREKSGSRRPKPAKNLHNLHSLLKLFVFCRLRGGEVFVVREKILLKIHGGKLVNGGDRNLVENKTVAGLAETARRQTQFLRRWPTFSGLSLICSPRSSRRRFASTATSET